MKTFNPKELNAINFMAHIAYYNFFDKKSKCKYWLLLDYFEKNKARSIFLNKFYNKNINKTDAIKNIRDNFSEDSKIFNEWKEEEIAKVKSFNLKPLEKSISLQEVILNIKDVEIIKILENKYLTEKEIVQNSNILKKRHLNTKLMTMNKKGFISHRIYITNQQFYLTRLGIILLENEKFHEKTNPLTLI